MIYFFLSTFLMLNSFAALRIDESNLSQLVDKNPDVQSLLKRLESSEALRGLLGRSFLPKISLSYGRERFSTGPYHDENQSFGGIEGEINIFRSGKDKIESAMRDNQAGIARLDSIMLRSQIIAELKKSLSSYAYLDELRIITSQALEQNEVNLKSAQKRISAGLASSTDLLDFKHQKIKLTQELATLDYERGVMFRLINTLLGNNAEENLELHFTNAHPDHSDESKINVSGKSLLLQKAQLHQETVQLEFKKNKRWWAPSLDLYGYSMRFTQKEREYTPSDKRDDTTFGFKFTVPFFDGGEGLRSVDSTKALVEAQKSEVRSRGLEIQRQTLDALKRLELAHNLIHGAEENVQIMNDYRRGILSEYSKGVKNSPDVLQASMRWIEAKMRNAEVKKNYQFAKAEVEYLSSLQGVQ